MKHWECTVCFLSIQTLSLLKVLKFAMLKKLLTASLLLISSSLLKAQQNVGIGTLTPSTDAILDLSSTTKGLLAPRVTSAERIAMAAASNGLFVYDTDQNKFFYWNATAGIWQIMQDFSLTNELNTAFTFDNTTKQFSITDAGNIFTQDLSILSQSLDFTNNILSLSDANNVDLSVYHTDSSTTNELIQTTDFNNGNKELRITDAGATFTEDLSILSQSLDFTNDVLSLSDANNVDLSVYHTDSSTTNELIQTTDFNNGNKELKITDAGATFTEDLSILSQSLNLTNDRLTLSDANTVDLTPYRRDESTTNELIQSTDFNNGNKELKITDAGATYTEDLSILSQSLNLTNDRLTLSDANTVDLTPYRADESTTNEIQQLSLVNTRLSLSRGGGFVDLPSSWNTNGNTGTNPGANYIGTRDNQDFVIRTNATERVRVKNNGRVGIGNNSPDETLDVSGNIELSGGSRSIHTAIAPPGSPGYSITVRGSNHNNSGDFAVNGGHVILQGGSGYNKDQGLGGGNIYLRTGANDLRTQDERRNGGYIIFETGGANNSRTETARVLDNGNFGIGTTAPSVRLQVGNDGDGSLARANRWSTFSDRRWKQNIELITNALDKLNQVNGYTYKWKNKADTSTQVGVIAQEIEAVLPEAVTTDAAGYKSVDYGKLSALLIQAVKEQQEIISSMEKQINSLQNGQKAIMDRLLKLEE